MSLTKGLRALVASVLTLFVLAAPAAAQSLDPASDENVFVFGGPLTSGYFSDVIRPWRWEFESNFFAGAGYQRFLYGNDFLRLGVEAGLGVRIGTPSSAEAWAGVVARANGLELGPITISPAVTGGFSVVTDTIGVETTRTQSAGQSAAILFYLGPEIAISHDEHPEWEAFGRIQHRSGGYGLIAHIDGSNAVTAGLRYKF